MNITRKITAANFTEGTADRIKYIVIHYVGATSSAEANANYFQTYRGASAHYFVGHKGEVYQIIEDKDIAWHCGSKSYKHPECRNSNSIGIEMCVKNNGSKAADSKDWYFEDETIEATIELVKVLMRKYNIPPENVIRHYDVTGKCCPNPYVLNNTEYTWEEFKEEIGIDGWFKAPEGWKYYENGKPLIGWNLLGNYWNYFSPEGILMTGWQKIDNGWFYFEEDGDYEGALWHETNRKDGSLERWYITT